MLLTNNFFGAILPLKKREKSGTRRIREMFFYENLKTLYAEENNELAVSPIEYVVLNCGR